ncbi:MAG: ATP-binding protein [Desulfovibrio sp.]|nr:ATP-binding protein [Desulfovibrio sp.]
MYEHWGKQSIILIDEYDVPIACAERNGYYEKIVSFLRNLFGNALKTNRYLKFAILTGCLRIARESIFTGLNNFKCYGIDDIDYSETFGFTPFEVNDLLAASGFLDKKLLMQEWYDGYRFGKDTEIYCPWDILQYVDDLHSDVDALPKCYWSNTSSNAIIKSFIARTDINITDKIETLLAGGYVEVEIVETLTYDTLHTSEDNLWSLLYLTGYLTKASADQLAAWGRKPEDNITFLVIPNKEIRKIFTKEIRALFDETVRKKNLDSFVEAVWSGDTESLQKNLTRMLYETISYHDSSENFYYAFLAGIFKGAGLQILSNRESGIGRSDICIIDSFYKRGVIIETKYADDYSKLDARADEALAQIQAKNYVKGMPPQITSIKLYGISFWKKECVVKIHES